ncbi:MAG: hypothetical protein GC192_01430 [Bacteroidetes bacterium]|nr:hypothetical protein [Bacteroidota bacterium]
MFHLLKLEWLKQKDYILFKILAIAYLVFLPAVLFVGKKMDLGPGAPFNPKVDFFQFPSIWGWLGYIGSWLTFFVLGFLAVLMVTNEFSNRTLRQNIIVGMSRSDFFKSKMIFMTVIAAFATVYYAICALIIGILNVNDTLYFSTVFKEVGMIPRFWLMSMGYMSFGLLIGLLVRKTGIALFIYLAYSLALETIIRWLAMFYLIKSTVMSFMPLNAIEDLAPAPTSFFINEFTKHLGFRILLTPWEAVISSSVYIGLFLYLGHKKLQKSDL